MNKIEADPKVLELLANSYMPEDHEQCHAIFLNFHEIAIEILGHTILPAKPNTLSELYAAVIRHLIVQQAIFPQAFAAYYTT